MRLRVVLIVPAAVACLTAGSGRPYALSSIDSRTVEEAEARRLLAAICRNDIEREISDGQTRLGCAVCPDGMRYSESFFTRLIWSIGVVTEGHFLRPDSEDTLVSMAGCEPHSDNFGGSVLLTKRSGRIEKVWYQAGLISDRCRKMAVPGGRDLLLCEDSYTGQGSVDHSLYTLDLALRASNRRHIFLTVTDTLGACYAGVPLRKAYIERTELRREDRARPALSVFVQRGMTGKLAPEVAVKCCAGMNLTGCPEPPTKLHRFDYVLRGSRFALAPGSESPRLVGGEQH